MFKNDRLGIRLSKDEKTELENIAKQNNKSGSSLIRELIAIAKKSPNILSGPKTNDGQTH